MVLAEKAKIMVDRATAFHHYNQHQKSGDSLDHWRVPQHVRRAMLHELLPRQKRL